MEHGAAMLNSQQSFPLPSTNQSLSDSVASLVDSNVAPKIVDLRSDTVTKPTAEMRAAMASAEVDDDVLGADPTVSKLQQQMAKIFGKEAGLFVPSGTMGNLIGVLAHCEVRGSECILGSECHLHIYEQGGMSTLGGVHPRTVPNKADGTMDLREVEAAIRPNNDCFPTTRLICIENTHNICGGKCVSVEYTDKIGDLAKRYGLKLHIDGARIFNAAMALGVSPKRLCQAADSISVCLSKGLAAPVGSVLVGSSEFIAKARRLRKALGGGMRQAGVIAAAGLISLQEMVGRLNDDHRHAKQLAEGLNAIAGLKVDVANVDTNIVNVDITTDSAFGAEDLCDILREHGILFFANSSTRIRLVTHYHISDDDVQYALAHFKDVLLKAPVKTHENGHLTC